MKKRFFNISMMFVLVLCTIFCISSCSKDDDKKGDEEQYSIIGRWKCAYSPADYDIVIFEKDGTGVLEQYYKGNIDQRELFTYSYSGAVLKMHFGNETETFTIAWFDENRFYDIDDPSSIYVRL